MRTNITKGDMVNVIITCKGKKSIYHKNQKLSNLEIVHKHPQFYDGDTSQPQILLSCIELEIPFDTEGETNENI